MRYLTPLEFLVSWLRLGAPAPSVSPPNPTGSLSLSLASDAQPFTFDYTTPHAKSKNWIGIYHTTGGGPDAEKRDLPALKWVWAPSANGSVRIDVPVGGGKFKAFFLANNGYKWLAEPIEVNAEYTGNAEDLKVMSWNMWYGGTKVNNYHEKQVDFLTRSGVDIVGVQESSAGGNHAKRLAEALGWNWHQEKLDVGILTRFPIVKKHANIGKGTGAQIALRGDESKLLNFWSAHLNWDPYGPYEFCLKHKNAKQVMQMEYKTGRPAEIQQILDETKDQHKSSTPFILVGDFNAPSHLDWTSANRDAHCNQSFEWPTSAIPIKAGLIDSFREAHPDPVAVSGNTWTPLYPKNLDEWKGQPEPQDRIDFIYGNERLEVNASETGVVGTPRIVPDHKDNEWTSDHRYVVTTYNMP